MPLSAVRASAAERFGVARLALSEIKANSPEPGTSAPADHHIRKAIFIVLLYAAWEYAVSSVVSQTANIITGKGVKCCDLDVSIRALAHDPELVAISTPGGRNTKWSRRSKLFMSERESQPAVIYESALSSDLGNLWPNALRQVYEAFGMPGSPFPDADSEGRINDLVNKRNSVAHGREHPVDVGQRYTEESLEILFSKIEIVKEHVFSHFEMYLRDKLYIIEPLRRSYG